MRGYGYRDERDRGQERSLAEGTRDLGADAVPAEAVCRELSYPEYRLDPARSSAVAQPVDGDEVVLSSRLDMAYMNSTVMRGRGEMMLTATGMGTEVGRVSGMLQAVLQEKTPLIRRSTS